MAFFAHRITSATAEGINSRIQAIRVQARGYRTTNFKTAIYFHLGRARPLPRCRVSWATHEVPGSAYFSGRASGDPGRSGTVPDREAPRFSLGESTRTD